MLEFRRSMDQHALDVLRDGTVCASLQWHKERTPRLVVWDAEHFTLDEMKQAVEQLTACVQKAREQRGP